MRNFVIPPCSGPALALALTLSSLPAAAGTPACGIFVSASQGTNDATCGLDPSDPCASISHGVTRAVAEGLSCVFVQAATYNGVLSLSASPVRIIGGYDADWNYAPWQQAAHTVTIIGGFDGATGQYLTVRLQPGADVEFVNLQIRGVNATGSIGGVARSSYAIHAVSATLALESVRVIGGNGVSGAPGGSGTNASQFAADAGGNGGAADEYVTACDATSRGAGGAAGIGAGGAQDGGAGGPGGTMDTSCPFNLTHTAGQPGMNAAVFQVGGYGYRGSGGSPCGPAANGFAGSSTHGAGGTGAPAGGSVAGNFWTPNAGGAGSLGAHGTGGGGGGGSGGCDTGTDSHGAGGGGGGAGGLRASSGGQGGRGGGSSFCVFAIGSALTLTGVELERGNGGMAGAGGTGGAGQPGGSGGFGGPADGDSHKGGDGGDGGRGGHSGGGGGGAGGSAYGVYACNSTYNASAVSFFGGGTGPGGPGGQPPFGGSLGGNAGSSGAPGSVYGAQLPACTVAQAGADVPPNARAPRVLAPSAALAAACDPAPCLLVDVPAAGERFPLSFAGASPNPTGGRATFRFSLPEPARATVRIFDAGGRLVRVLDAGTLGAGRHRLEWDGRNGSGARAGAGVYFAKFEALETGFTRRFTMVR